MYLMFKRITRCMCVLSFLHNVFGILPCIIQMEHVSCVLFYICIVIIKALWKIKTLLETK